MPSPEFTKANQDLLERMQEDFAQVFDPKLKVLAGKSIPNPSEHFDSRMNQQLTDMVKCYNPPQAPLKTIRLVTKREHKSQVETENAERAAKV